MAKWLTAIVVIGAVVHVMPSWYIQTANTTFWIDPENRLVCILMTQRLPARYPIGKEFQELVYGAMTD